MRIYIKNGNLNQTERKSIKTLLEEGIQEKRVGRKGYYVTYDKENNLYTVGIYNYTNGSHEMKTASFTIKNKETGVQHDIESVYVEMSESCEFEDDTTYTYEEFNNKCQTVVNDCKNNDIRHYFKTYITVKFTDGEFYQFRFDLSLDEKNIKEAFEHRIRYYKNNGIVYKNEEKIAQFWNNFTYRV
jgi:hypothetical protein